MKKLSVIVPVYNVEKYLERCVNSIINQTYTNLEIILVDDGSTDRSGVMCDDYAKSDLRIQVIHKVNGGLSDARNAGIEASTGEYLAFIDSDDYIDSTMFQEMIVALEGTGSDVALCNYECVDEEGKLLPENSQEVRVVSEELTSEQALDKLCKLNGFYYTIACNKIYKKDLFAQIRFRKGKLHEDEFIVHEIYAEMSKMVCLENAFYMYVQRTGSITNKKRTTRHLDLIEALFLRTRFYVETQNAYNAKYTFGMALGKFLELIGMIEQKDAWYYERVEQLLTMCKEIFFVIPKKYFRPKLWVRCIVICFCSRALYFEWVRRCLLY